MAPFSFGEVIVLKASECVFVPGGHPTHTFVNRTRPSQQNLDRKLLDALDGRATLLLFLDRQRPEKLFLSKKLLEKRT